MKHSSLFSQLSLYLKKRDNSLCSSNLQKNKSAFTLVELIVVITILAILALVAFLMMSNATVSARDSNRLASIKNIYDASQLQAVQQRLLPLPDQAITLTVSGTDIGWQGYMSGYIAQSYENSDSVYDPRDNTPYIYRVNQTRNKSQYLAYLENGGEVAQGDILLALGGFGGFGIDTAQATDFSKRVPYVYGDRLGVVLSNTTNEGANVALGSGGTLDLGGGSIDSNYFVYVNEGLKLASVDGTGAVALKMNGGLDQVIANATIVASSNSNSGSGSGSGSNDPTCGLTSQEVIDLNSVRGDSYTAEEWCAMTSIGWNNSLLTTLPSGIIKLTSLGSIDLTNNTISSLPSGFANLTNLTELNLSENNFTEVPSDIEYLTNLTDLDFSYNQISLIPEFIGNLSNLTGLSFWHNTSISTVPDSLDNLTNLTYLDFEDNTLLGDLGVYWSIPDTYSENAQTNITPLGQDVYISASSSYPTIRISVGSPLVVLSPCGLTQQEVDEMNIPFEVINGYTMNATEWCDTYDLNLTGESINSTVLGGIMKLINLNYLTLEDTGISNIPSSLGNLINLFSLNLNGNTFNSLPESIGNLTSLESLSLAWNSNLTSLPDSIGNLTNLWYLDLQGSNLGTLTTLFEAGSNDNQSELNITPLGQEVHIRASGDPTIEIIVGPIPLPDPGSCGITGLEIVELNNYGFRDIGVEGPGNILNLLGEDWCALTTLDISGYSLETIPTGILKLGNLEELNISNNNFLGFPSEILALTSLTHLYAYNNGFVSIPNNISDLTQLTFLGLSDNALTGLPDNIGSLSQLTRLEIGRNQIANLPTTLGNLSNLQELFAEYNLLTSLPSNIGSMSSLYQLYVPHNQISSLPTSVGDLSNLNYLSINDNQIVAIPSTIDGCVNLSLLQADNNLLTELPEEIGNLPSLWILNLANNQLQTLPDNLSGLHGKLVELTLSGNSMLGNLNRNFSDVTSGMQVGTFVQSNITPTGKTITLHLPNIDRQIDITVTP